jgi:hypothetical protein
MDQLRARRLSDKILEAFDQACDRHDIEVAELPVKALEIALTRIGGPNQVDKRENMQPLIEAFDRLQRLRQEAAE